MSHLVGTITLTWLMVRKDTAYRGQSRASWSQKPCSLHSALLPSGKSSHPDLFLPLKGYSGSHKKWNSLSTGHRSSKSEDVLVPLHLTPYYQILQGLCLWHRRPVGIWILHKKTNAFLSILFYKTLRCHDDKSMHSRGEKT